MMSNIILTARKNKILLEFLQIDGGVWEFEMTSTEPARCLPKIQAALDKLDEDVCARLRTALYEAEERQMIPGMWRCPKCRFVVMKQTINANSGSVGVSMADCYESDLCPNDGELLQRVTWQEEAEDNLNHATRMREACKDEHTRMLEAEAGFERVLLELTALKTKLAEAEKVLGRLPLTADGVPITLGMNLHLKHVVVAGEIISRGGFTLIQAEWHGDGPEYSGTFQDENGEEFECIEPGQCYSIDAAALAARLISKTPPTPADKQAAPDEVKGGAQ